MLEGWLGFGTSAPSPAVERKHDGAGPAAQRIVPAQDAMVAAQGPRSPSTFAASVEHVHDAVREQSSRLHSMTKLMLDSAMHDVESKLIDLRQRVEKLERGGTVLPRPDDVQPDRMQNLANSIREDLVTQRQELQQLHAQVLDANSQSASAPTASGSLVLELQRRIQEVYHELKSEITTLRVAGEHSAIKAGFLAVAATECSREEKAQLFTKLKAREQALHHPGYSNGRDVGVVNSTPIEDIIPNADLSQGPGSEFIVDVKMDTGALLGASSRSASARHLVVDSVENSVLGAWNARNPRQLIRPGDLVVEVNGRSGTSETLTAQVAAITPGWLKMRIVRGVLPVRTNYLGSNNDQLTYGRYT